MCTRTIALAPTLSLALAVACSGGGGGSGGPDAGTPPSPSCALAAMLPAYSWPGTSQLGALTGGTLEACGWPGPENTGPAAGTAFTDCARFSFDRTKVDGAGNPNVVHRDGDECWLEIRVPVTVERVRGITGAYVAADLTLRDCILSAVDDGAPDDVGMVNVQAGATLTAERVFLDGGAHTGERGLYGAGGAIVVRSSELLHCGAACVEGDRWDAAAGPSPPSTTPSSP